MKFKKFAIIISIAITVFAVLGIAAACDIGGKGTPSTKTPLSAPVGLKSAGEKLSWEKVAGAKEYMLRIGAPDGTSSDFKTTAADYALQTDSAGEYKVSVKAISGDSSKSDSSFSPEIIVRKAASPTGVTFKDDGNSSVLVWDATEGAADYTVRIGNKEFITASNEFDLKSTFLSDYPSIAVRANDGENVIASAYSSPFRVNSVGTVGLRVNDKAELEWTADISPYVSRVTLTIDGETPVGSDNRPIENLLDLSEKKLSIAHLLKSVGDHTIIVNVLSAAPATHKDAAEKIIAKVVSAPTLRVENGKLTAENVDPDAKGLSLICTRPDGSVIVNNIDNASEIYTGMLPSGVYDVKVAVNPKQNFAEGEFYLGSAYSEELKQVTKLSAPVVEMKKGVAEISEVDSAGAYLYTIDGGTERVIAAGGVTKIILESFGLAAGSHIIEVKSVADGGNFLNSDFSAPVECVALRSSALTIENRVLKWTSDSAAAYKLSVDSKGDSDIVPERSGSSYSYDLTREQAFGEGKHVLAVKAVPAEDKIIPFVSKIEFTVLAKPQLTAVGGFISATGENVGLSVKNLDDGSEVEIVLTAYDMQLGYKLDGMKAGRYELSARRIGDESKLFGSAYSDPLAVEKLAAPTSLKLTDTKTLTWDAVDSASGYIVEIRNERLYYSSASAPVTELQGFTRNEIKVVATNSSGNYVNSEWAYFDKNGGAGRYWSGAGTEADPYVITDFEQLSNVRQDAASGAHFVLVNNIKAEGSWTPVRGFNGVFDGAGYEISGLTIDAVSGSEYGFFASLSGATLKNIKLRNASITLDLDNASQSEDLVFGLLAGSAADSVIVDCEVQGSVLITDAPNAKIGGLAGKIAGSSVTRCKADAAVTYRYTYETTGNKAYVGGAIGLAEETPVTVSQLASLGAVSVSTNSFGTDVYVGGAIADIRNGSATISDCYASGKVEVFGKVSKAVVGGFAGNAVSALVRCAGIGGVSVTDCTTESGVYAAGFVAMASGKASLCYSDGKVESETLPRSNTNKNEFYVAGFIADHTGSAENCYSACDVRVTYYSGKTSVEQSGLTGSKYVAGFVASSTMTDYKNCYFAGRIAVDTDIAVNAYKNKDKLGANVLVGSLFTEIQTKEPQTSVSECFYISINDFAAVQMGGDAGEKLEAEQFLNISVFRNAGWEIGNTLDGDDSVWYLDGNKPPVLRWAIALGI